MVDFIKNHHIYVLFLWYVLMNFALFFFMDRAIYRKPKKEFGFNMFIVIQKEYVYGIGLWIFIGLFARDVYKMLFPPRITPKKDESVSNP